RGSCRASAHTPRIRVAVRPYARSGAAGPGAADLLDMDRRDGARYVRTDDRGRCVDDDRALGCTAPAVAVGNWGRHYDGNDAPICLTAVAAIRPRRATNDTGNGRAPPLCARGWLFYGLGGVQCLRKRAPAIFLGVSCSF